MDTGIADTFMGNRAKAGARLTLRHDGAVSRLADLKEWGGYRLKFPDPAGVPEAVLINTGGGMAGGDALEVAVTLEPGAALTFTTQSAERVYRSHGPDSTVAVALSLAGGADLVFVPQETILFQHARLTRTIAADLTADSRLLIAETLVFGRAASGERLTAGHLHDRWRIRRGGRLIYADDVRLSGPIAGLLQRPAIGGGAGASASLLYVAPDAADRLEETRNMLEGGPCRAAASSWNGLLCVRALGEPGAVRRVLATAISVLSRRTLPRVWSY